MQADLRALCSRLEASAGKRRATLVPVLIMALFALVSTASWRVPRVREWIASKASGAGPRQIKSVAVLPLKNLTGDSSQDYFVDGTTDALITDLTKLSSLRVISSTSSMLYKGTHKTLPEIAHELNVDAAIVGTVMRSGDHVRISAQLVDARSNQNLWARDYDDDLKDVLKLQSELATAVAQEVAVKLTPEERTRLTAKQRVVDPRVYEADLKGRYFSSRANDEGLRKGVEYFREAIRLDPNYAPAYAGLSENYSIQAIGWGGGAKDPEHLAIEAATKAISLDDSLAEAHASLAFVLHRHMQDWSGAEREFKRALELNPGYAMAHHRYGVFLRTVGQPDSACEESRLAHELDPLHTNITSALAGCINAAGHFEEAVQMMKGTIEMEPDNPGLRWALGDIYERHNMFPEALEQYQKGAEVSGRHQYLLSLMASAYAGWGKTAEAEKLFEEMKQRFGEDDWLSALIHARMGRKEQAIRELAKNFDENCGPGKCGPGASLFVSEWRFDPLRADPRFQALLKLYHYPDSAFKK
jgi:pentatricopeptide repeat protein